MQNLKPNDAVLLRGRENKRKSLGNLARCNTVERTPTVLNTFHKPDWRRLAVDVAVLRPSWAREPLCDSYLMQPGVEHGLVQGRLDRPLEDACRRRHDRLQALLHDRQYRQCGVAQEERTGGHCCNFCLRLRCS